MSLKRKRSPRLDTAIKLYLDPGSETFGNKAQSIMKAGYAEATARHDASELLSDTNFTRKDLTKIETFLAQDPQIDELLKAKLQQLKAKGEISAKDYSNLIRHKQLVLDAQGILKKYVESRHLSVNVTIPVSKCPQCGYEMDIMKREYEGGEKNGESL